METLLFCCFRFSHFLGFNASRRQIVPWQGEDAPCREDKGLWWCGLRRAPVGLAAGSSGGTQLDRDVSSCLPGGVAETGVTRVIIL